MLDQDDKKIQNRIRTVVKGNKGISLEKITRTLDESTDLVLNYIETMENVVEYRPNKFRIDLYCWLNDRTGEGYVDGETFGKTFISKEQACKYLFNSILCVSESTRQTYKQSSVDLQLETIRKYGYTLTKEL